MNVFNPYPKKLCLRLVVLSDAHECLSFFAGWGAALDRRMLIQRTDQRSDVALIQDYQGPQAIELRKNLRF